MPASAFEPCGHCKMDDAAFSIRQYVAALSRLLLDFDNGEFGRCDGCRVGIPPIQPVHEAFCKPLIDFFQPVFND